MLSSPSASPSAKKAKIEDGENITDSPPPDDPNEDSENNCSICLQPMEDRTVIPTCSHEFCFDCLMIWAVQSRRCPLCTQTFGDYVIHDIRSRFDYRKHHLAPLRPTSPQLLLPPQTTAAIEARNAARRRRRDRERERQQREELDERDKLEHSIATRRWIYKHDLYAKHVASNSFTKYRPYPTPAQFAGAQDLISRTTTFLRRELQVWQGLDVEFLTNLIISLMKSIDIRSESAVKLLAEFLDMEVPNEPRNRRVNAEHLAHGEGLLLCSVAISRSLRLIVSMNVHQISHHLLRHGVNKPGGGRHLEKAETAVVLDHLQGRLGKGIVEDLQENGEGGPGISADSGDTDTKVGKVGRDRQKDETTLYNDGTGFGLEQEKDNGVISNHTARHLHRSPNGDRVDNPVFLRNIALDSPRDCGTSNSVQPHLSRLDDPKGKRKLDGHETIPSAEANDNGIHLPPPHASNSSTIQRYPSARARPPRQKSLFESVQAHLKTNVSVPRSIKLISGEDAPKLHTPSNRNSHCQSSPYQRTPLQRLSDPVTNTIDEQQSSQRYATESRPDDNIGGTSVLKLASEVAAQVTSNTYPIKEAIAAHVFHDSASGVVDSMDNDSGHMNQPRPSPLSSGNQVNFGQTTDARRTLATSPMEVRAPKVAFGTSTSKTYRSSPTDVTAIDPSAVHMRPSDPGYINSVHTSKEAHQFDKPHVGSTCGNTHDPHNAAPITARQDEILNKSLRSDLRSKLLSRLEEERKQALSSGTAEEVQNRNHPSFGYPLNADGLASTSAMDRTSPKDAIGGDESSRQSMRDCRDHLDGKSPDPISEAAEADTVVSEARLRARMQLRTRLAAEKRLGGSK
ncbi:hypothetical protein P691DRAFT_759702 [Macrolepiota fuliginosa MF-IS2]|uniref:RING-type E3 ubiquitin transferase n=1 Tax=Macrolepiota fuliginosa MF-IS2 TaxID=1400762 RepID=A0A9P6C4Y7_9AGAR|nr:hypothetical protein P691DRAFT_759702 [Macrolepiota fuliginosa MF-IS2]